MSDIEDFKISVSDDKIARLKQKLALTDFPDEVVDEKPWVRGPPLSDIKRLANRWANGYDWRKAETELNKFPQFMTKISIDNFDTYGRPLHPSKEHCPRRHSSPLLPWLARKFSSKSPKSYLN